MQQILTINSEHKASNCKKRKICKVCKERHPTSLHGIKPKERSQDTNQKDNLNSPGDSAIAEDNHLASNLT